jgi:hypothetical protein
MPARADIARRKGRPTALAALGVDMAGRKRSLACSFCGKPADEVAKLVAGPRRILRRAYICDACIAIAVRLMAEPDPVVRSMVDRRI